MSISSISGSNWPSAVYNKDKTRQNVQGSSDPSNDPVLGLMGSSAAITPSASQPVDDNDPVKQFTDYMKKTPEQRYQESWLKQHGVSPEQFAAMSPAEQKKLIDEMQHELEEKMKAQAGSTAKGSAADLLV